MREGPDNLRIFVANGLGGRGEGEENNKRGDGGGTVSCVFKAGFNGGRRRVTPCEEGGQAATAVCLGKDRNEQYDV